MWELSCFKWERWKGLRERERERTQEDKVVCRRSLYLLVVVHCYCLILWKWENNITIKLGQAWMVWVTTALLAWSKSTTHINGYISTSKSLHLLWVEVFYVMVTTCWSAPLKHSVNLHVLDLACNLEILNSPSSSTMFSLDDGLSPFMYCRKRHQTK